MTTPRTRPYNTNGDLPELLTKEEVAQWLKVSERTVQDWVLARLIPSIRVGRLVRFERLALVQWLEAKKGQGR